MTSPTISSSASPVLQSTSQNINALLGPTKWGVATGSGALLTYSFPWTSSATAVFAGYNGGTYSSINEPTASVHFGLNASQQAAAGDALRSWADVANIAFAETQETASSAGDIRFGFTSANYDGSWGWAAYPNGYYPSGGDVWISATVGQNNPSSESWAKGTYIYEGLLHETGHALGLKHPFEGTTVLPVSLDDEHNTVMSYKSPANNLYYSFNGQYWSGKYVSPETPMVLDVAAIQHIYGANTSYHAGNDAYTFDPATPFFRTIWDAAGNDTLSAASFTLPCRIDLTPGSYSSLKFALPKVTAATYDGTENLGIAYGCIIENALGGSSNDVITGNSANNGIDGGNGTDTAVFSGFRASHTISRTSSGWTVSSTTDGTDTLSSVERLKFTDGTLAIDNGNWQTAGEAYRLYQAAFARTPDTGGLKYWVSQMDSGQTVEQVAYNFIASAEFQSMYGTNPSHVQEVTAFYQHVLGRAPDQGGLDYWTGLLDSGQIVPAQVLINFSESAENVALVGTTIQNGIWLGN